MTTPKRVYLTNRKHFAIFKAECERRIKQFRIVGWRTDYLHEKIDARAECRSDAVTQTVVFVLSTDWGDQIPPTDACVRRAARHEVIHLIVDKLNEAACFRFVTKDQHKHALESTVRHLEELLP
jgi:hypothetical protein